jgi:hypothetical protein
MKKLTATLIALLAASSGWCADPPEKKEVPLPVQVMKAEEIMNANVQRARAAYSESWVSWATNRVGVKPLSVSHAASSADCPNSITTSKETNTLP